MQRGRHCAVAASPCQLPCRPHPERCVQTQSLKCWSYFHLLVCDVKHTLVTSARVLVQVIPEDTTAVTLIGPVHRYMPSHQRCIRTPTMTSLFPQLQKPSCKLCVGTTPKPVHANQSGFTMCRWVRTNRAHLQAPTVARLPELPVCSRRALAEPRGRPVPPLLFTTSQKLRLLKQQVPQNYCRGSQFMTSPPVRDLQKSRVLQRFHLRGNTPPEFLEITSTITFRWSAGGIQAKLMNSNEFVFSE